MNIKDYANQLKVKFDLVSNSWNKLTIEQLEQVENLLDKLIQEVDEARTKPIMTEEMCKEIEILRTNNVSWKKIANKFGYKNGPSMCASYFNYKNNNTQQ